MEIEKDSNGNLSFISINDKKVFLSLTQKNHIRRMTLRFAPDRKTLFIITPYQVKIHMVESFLTRAHLWIEKKLEAIEQEETLIKNGALVCLFGKDYQVSMNLGFTNKAWIEKDSLYIQVRHERHLEATLGSFFRQEALCFFTERSHYYAKKIGKIPTAIKVRDLRSRWGSCTSKGSLSFSWRLAFAPLSVAEYVAIHEVVHLQFLDHSKSFWSSVRELCPDYEKDKKWLKKRGVSLFNIKIEN